ncbi:MAG: rubrerythrin family protein [Thermoproteus sp. AZ2]|jgi:rubrerythrin|uniref:Rubrerythrin family protein n=1 Tax=Thermoproteus sp. AZ2 TaxID=1609232 RepID=A0ACC6V111_9CREN|nr:MAG: rubrerythrin [Thermoproteus sp. AZ2]
MPQKRVPKGTKTYENLKVGFQGESMANRRYLYYARLAREHGLNDIAEVFEKTANAETGHAFGHLIFLGVDPVAEIEINDIGDALRAAIYGETYEWTQMYPGFARVAREEGFNEVAEWFETLAKIERFHAGRFNEALDKYLKSKGVKTEVEDEVLVR